MNLTVQYLGQIGHVIGCEQETIACPEPIALARLLQVILDRHGEAVRPFVFDANGQPTKSLLVSVNDKMASTTAALMLQPGDEVSLLPPIAGG